MRSRFTRVACVVVAALAIAGCGSDDSSDDGAGAQPTTAGTSTATSGTTEDTEVGFDDSYERGPVGIRVVNLLDQDVDIYVRTSGLVQAYLVAGGVPPGVVSEFYNPPPDGELVVTTNRSGDPECVIDCSHFLAEVGTDPENGPAHTLVLVVADGSVSSLDLWEQPAVLYGNANEIVPADPTAGIVVVTGYGVEDADFGLRMGISGTPGCVEPFNLSGVLIGGNQTPAFLLPSSPAEVTLYDNNDRECYGTPVGGPFTIDAGPGQRVHLILHGTVAAGVQGIILPMQ